MKKTILLLSHVGFDNTPYCSYVHSHAKALVKKGYNVIVLASLRWFPFISIIKKRRKKYYENYKGEKIIDGVKVIYFKSLSISKLFRDSKINFNGLFYYLAIKKKVNKIMKSENVVLIDAHTFKIEGYVASKLKSTYKNIPSIVTCHGTSFYITYDTEKGKKYIKNIASNLDWIICVSEDFKRKLSAIGVNNTKVIYNGINFFNEFKNSTKKVKKDYNGIITLGSLIKRKNINIVIEAFEKIYKINKNARLTIIGEGILKQNLMNLCDRLKVSNVVNFKGQISNQEVYKLMKENNIFVLPSVREGFGICYLEAMYNECIVIGTKGEGIDGFIKDKQNGFLVSPNVEDVSKVMEYIMGNREKCEVIRKRGKEDAKKMTWAKNAFEYEKLILEKE